MTNQETNAANRAQTTLTGTLSAGATTINVADTTDFPAVPFYATLAPEPESTTTEIVLVDSGKTGTTFVLTAASSRGQDGTTDQEHPAGTVIAYVHVAALWSDINDRADANAAAASAAQATADAAYTPAGTDVAVTDGGTGASTAAAARTNLGLAIGTDVQAHSAVLDATTASFLTADETKLDAVPTPADIVVSTGATFTGNVEVAGFQHGQTTLGTATPTLDFSGDQFLIHALGAETTYSTSNRAVGRSLKLRLTSVATRAVNFPAGWRWAGGAAPTEVAAGGLVLIELDCFGTAESDIVARSWTE